MQILFDANDYRPLKEDETYEGKFVIISPKYFKPEFRNAKYQLFLAKGGFGCDPAKLGNAVFGSDCEEAYRQGRYNILGVATEEAIQNWEKIYNISREVFYDKD
jgi:hypothetical protein